MTFTAALFLIGMSLGGCVIGILSLTDREISRGALVVGTWSSIALIILLLVLFYSINIERKYTEQDFDVINKENIDFMFYNNEFINLNEKFGRDFEGSVRLKVYPACYCGWIYYHEKIAPTWQ